MGGNGSKQEVKKLKSLLAVRDQEIVDRDQEIVFRDQEIVVRDKEIVVLRAKVTLHAAIPVGQEGLRMALADRDRELVLLRAPVGCILFLGVKFNRAWGVINLFFAGYAGELIALGMEFQGEIDVLNGLMHLWLLDPRVWTRKKQGFDLPSADCLTERAAEPGLSLRRPVMVHLRRMQATIVPKFVAYVGMLSDTSYKVLAGDVYNP